ncbi:MAG TPA: PEGA domain-containing protein, partial [Polyangiales bacterium]|nr:PEGA domain-containing protein [Polyangiales bacterium]
CRALALDVGPTTYLHPGPVLETFKAADEELRRRLAGRLTVTSEPAHCTVLLNGRALGLTPYEVRPPIGPQRVQVECPGDQEPGRVHSVPVAQGDVTLRVWVGFESALRSEPGKPLRLQLDSQQALAQHALEYAHEIGRVLGVEHVLLVRSFEPDSVVFERADAPEKHLQAEVSYDAARGTGSDLRPALRALAEGRSWRRDPNLPLDCGDRARAMVEAGQRVEAQAFVLRCLQAGRPDVDGTQQPPQVTELYDAAWQQLAHEAAYDGSAQSASGQDIKLSTVPPPSPRGAMQSRREEDEGPRAAGALPVLGTIVGAAGMVSAAVLFDASDTRSGRSAAIGLEAVSSAVLLPSFAIWTFPRTRDGVPWWSWTAGAAGLAGLAWGIRDLAVNDVCKRPDRGCAPGHYGADLDGGMLFAASAPFVLLPLAHALWNHDGPQSSEVAVTPTGRGLTITGRF